TRALRNTTTPSVTLDNTDAGGASLGQRDSPETGPIRWVSGAWSECSEWCGVGLQHRQVSCGMPLVRDAHPLTAGYLLDPASCGKHHQPREAQLCQGPCSHVDCSVKDNVLHPACYKLLQDSSLEKDHIDEPVLRGSSRT
ncbi:hypothetical protein OTU49_000010, partial [Cherax quadricarinatus]